MALIIRGDGLRIPVVAGGARTGGTPIVDEGFAGVPVNTVASGAEYTMYLYGEFELTYVATAARGSVVYITDADGTLTLAAGVGKRVFGRVSKIQGDSGCPTGKMWVVLAGVAPVTG